MLWIVQGFPKETLVYLGLKFDIFSYWQRYPKSSLVKDLILYKIINLHGLNTTVHLYERHWNIVQLYLYTVSIARELQYFTARKSRQDSMKIFLLLLLGVLAAEASYNIYLTSFPCPSLYSILLEVKTEFSEMTSLDIALALVRGPGRRAQRLFYYFSDLPQIETSLL